MRAIVASVCAVVLGTHLPTVALAAPAEDVPSEETPAAEGPASEPPAPATVDETIAAAEADWKAGRYRGAREQLEPIVGRGGKLGDTVVQVRALEVLADATVNDETLSESARRQLASDYLERLMDGDDGWQLPTGIYSPRLLKLYNEVKDERKKAEADQCIADRNACRADLSEQEADKKQVERKLKSAEQKLKEQPVEVIEQEKRSRAWALIPVGVGHFYSGNIGLGATFATIELGLGAAGLGLILQRTIGDDCRRTNGFAPGSLQCSTDDRAGVLRRRQAEEAIGWILIGTVVLDIVLAQILFRPTEDVARRTVTRERLEAERKGAGKKSKRKRRRGKKPRAKVRPASAAGPQGATVGVRVRF